MTPEERLARLETHVEYLRAASDDVKSSLGEVHSDVRELMKRSERNEGIQQGVWKERALNVSGAALLVTATSWILKQLW